MRVLIIGSGGREHALTRAVAQSPKLDKLFIAPGNGGTKDLAEPIKLDITDNSQVVEFAKNENIDLVIVGPEAPLVQGLADELRAAGIDTFGPGSKGAQLEGSKRFAKEFLMANDVPTAQYRAFTDKKSAIDFLDTKQAPIVVKADGLAAGKGVTVAQTIEEAKEAVENCFEGSFGDAGQEIIIEERLTGPECSLLALVTDDGFVCLEPAQDHKPVGEGDTGPNTGGMGAFSPVPSVTPKDLEQMKECMKLSFEGLKKDGIDDFRGVLYGGFMLTTDGPKVLEFNVRFGDPEAQVLLPRISSDVLEHFKDIACGTCPTSIEWSDDIAITVVMCSEGYPRNYKKGKVIRGIDKAEQENDVYVYHAGTAINEQGELVTAGGRVLNVTAMAPNLDEARKKAYSAVDKISFEGAFVRNDIGIK